MSFRDWKGWLVKKPELTQTRREGRWSGFGELDRLFGWDGEDGPFPRDLALFDPSSEFGVARVDVKERRKKVEVTADVPGLSEKDIQLSLSSDHNALLLYAERKHESEDEDDAGWVCKERHYGAIHRTIRLPCTVELEDAEAKVKRGVLHVTLKKRSEPEQIKRISVRSE